MTLASVFGLSGPELTANEAAFFADVRPWGFILFRRNVQTPSQVKALTESLRRAIDSPDAPILIDQEGGRVQRLGPPHWPVYPPARTYLQVARDPFEAREMTRLAARLMAADLAAVGVNVDCAPVVDVPAPGAHDIIGDRAFATSPAEVAMLARASAEGLIAGRVLPVIKHAPGHGRAESDSHEALPVVRAELPMLDESDFAPFRSLSDMPIAMTAHVVFSAVDSRRPATTSRKVIASVIRERLGFGGLLVGDDLSMKALRGDLASRARHALKAGCDMVLHCNGEMDEMRAVASAARPLRGRAARRAEAALRRLPAAPEPLDEPEARARLRSFLQDRAP